MSDTGSLRRLGGGRWQSRDGRFTIEPQSGTWVVVDGEESDDLGLPLVRGPFRSLGAAREAIEVARGQGPSSSPLTSRVEEAARRPARNPGSTKGTTASGDSTRAPKGGRAKPTKEPREPAWLRTLEPSRRRAATELMRRLERAGASDAERIARAEIVDDEPTAARIAIEERLASVVGKAADPEAAARAVLKILVSGRDPTLEVTWCLVDGEGRRIKRVRFGPT